MPIVLLVLFGFLLGVTFAWMARAELGRVDAPIVATRPFNVVLGFAALVYGPVAGYFVAFHGDWSYGYVLAWRRVPSAVDLALVLAAGCSVIIGLAAAAHAARARRLSVVGWLVLLPTAASVFAIAAAAPRLAVSATYAQYHGGFGVVPIGSSALGRGVLLMGLVVLSGVAWTARALGQGEDEEQKGPTGSPRVDL